jgi:hypothetical protein
MKISIKWLEKNGACSEGKEWFQNQQETDGVLVIKKLIGEKQYNWANWTIVRLMTHKQKVQYAVYAAEQVIEIFEKKYQNDKRPREAIEAAKAYLKDPSDKNKNAAANAANAAYAAAYAAAYTAAYTAAYAADAAADAAAYAAAYSAYSAYSADAAYSAYAAANAAANAAAYAAADAAYAAAKRKELKIKIINNGMMILKSSKGRKTK